MMKGLLFVYAVFCAPLVCSALSLDRRSVIQGAGAAVTSTFFSSPVLAAPTTDSSLIVPPTKSVVVLGANGGTGRACVEALLNDGRRCIATTRSGILSYDINPDSSQLLTTASVDVTSLESLSTALVASANIGAVIFAASASTKGGNSFAVDRDGVLKAAEACIANNIPRLVVVSSGTVTRPDSAVYKLLNTVGKGIMEAKIQGEDGMREMYADPKVLERKLGYTVIRPGGLTTGEGVGVSGLELNQGDNKSGRLARADVASLCIKCLDSPSAFDVTFECYETVTAKPVESVGLSNILKSTDATTFRSGKERQGTTWEAIFEGLERDAGHSV